MRSAARLQMTPSQFRQAERAAASRAVDELARENAAAYARREEWAVWLLEVWRPYRLGERSSLT